MIDADEHNPYSDAIYVEGTDRLKPQVIIFFAVTWSIAGLALLYGLYKLIHHVVVRIRWRRHCRRVGCAGRHRLVTATRANRLRQTRQFGSNIEIPELFSPADGSLDFNNNQTLIPRGSVSVQMVTDSPSHRMYYLETTQFQTNSESRLNLQKLKISDFNIFNELRIFDVNNNRIQRFVRPIIFPISVENKLFAPSQEQPQIAPVELEDISKILRIEDEEPESIRLEIQEERPLEPAKALLEDESEIEADTDDVSERKLPDDTRGTSVASNLGLFQHGGPSPNQSAYLIPETYVRQSGPPLFQQIKAIPMPPIPTPIPTIPTQDVLEYSQADGGWFRKKIENYVPGPCHKHTFPKEEKMFGTSYMAKIFEPINRYITSVITPDPSSTTIDVPDLPAQFDLTEYKDSDQALIRQEIQRLTRIRSSMGLVSFFNLIQGEGSLRLEELVVVPGPPQNPTPVEDQPIESILSAPSSTDSKLSEIPEYDPESESQSKTDLVEVIVSPPTPTSTLEEYAEPVLAVSSSNSAPVVKAKTDENIKAVQGPDSRLINTRKAPRKCCCC